MTIAVTATLQDSYPPRVVVAATGLTVGDFVELSRVVGGVRTPVRGGLDESVSDTSFVRVDAELPFGVPVHYHANVNDVGHDSTTATYTLTGGKVALSDAVSGLAAEVVILAWPDKAYSPQSSTFKVGGRNVVVQGALGQFESTVELFTETTSSRDNLWALLRNCTEGIIQVRQPGGYDGVDSYIAVTDAKETRWSQDGSDPRRRHTLQIAEVEPWASVLEAHGYTLQDLADAYAGQTLADLAMDYPTLLAVSQGDFGV